MLSLSPLFPTGGWEEQVKEDLGFEKEIKPGREREGQGE